jgi:hypothetical protein
MPNYQRGNEQKHVTHTAFDQVYTPGQLAPHSGIYRCIVCGWEVTNVGQTVLPPQNHHLHAPGRGPIQWRLSSAAIHEAN